MKSIKILLFVAVASFARAGRLGCDMPLSEDNGIKFAASSYEREREPYRARLGESKAWCAKTIVKYAEYLQVNLGSLRHVSAIELQGAKWSFIEYFVKTFLVSYSIDGKKYKFYKSKSGSKVVPWTIFNGNKDSSHPSVNEIHPAFVAKYVRIYPLTFNYKMCMKVEVYGCNETVDCTHVVRLARDQRATVTTPSYPLPYRNDAHCNWLVYLPKPEIPLSIVAMVFDVGGSTSDQISCASPVVQFYRDLHPFSKYRIGSYCNNSKMAMPRETKLTTDSLRISFTGGDNHVARHRGFSILLWSSQQDYKTAKACQNSMITLNCTDAEQDIEVISAFYGIRPNSPVCGAENETTANTTLYTDSCKAPDVLPKLQAICDYRNICKIMVDDDNFSHDCTSGYPLEMFVVYQCNVTKHITTTSTSKQRIDSTLSTNTMSTSSSVIYADPTTTPPPTTPTTEAATTEPVKATESDVKPTSDNHGATTKILAKHTEGDDNPVVMIAAIGGGMFLIFMIVIVIITCVCCKNRNNEKKKGVVTSESTQSKVMVESESLYEEIDDVATESVRYSETEPSKRSQTPHVKRLGMSENPLYQSGGPVKANSSYDVQNTPRYENHSQLNRPHSVGNPLQASSVPHNPVPHYVDVLKSPEELPANSPPMVRYLAPSRCSPPDSRVTIPLDQFSDSENTPNDLSPGGEDVYEPMDGSNA